jgi:hypothetical protein
MGKRAGLHFVQSIQPPAAFTQAHSIVPFAPFLKPTVHKVHTKQGKRYKILTLFFVFSASSTCHGTSSIKVFDMKNRYIGEYYVGMPEGLPDIL